MENLNNLIWTDEDSNDIRPQIDMQELCLVAFCKASTSGGSNDIPGFPGITNGLSGSAGGSWACRDSP